jgi:hypothetical protein
MSEAVLGVTAETDMDHHRQGRIRHFFQKEIAVCRPTMP